MFDSPEAAAMEGFPPERCRVVASAVQEDEAYVVLDTGPVGHPYLYGSAVSRGPRGWEAGTSGNGPSAGWTLTDFEHDLGTSYIYDLAPAGADRVRAVLDEDVEEVAVGGAVYLVSWWRVPFRETGPKVLAFRVGGTWKTQMQGSAPATGNPDDEPDDASL
jgi:hypothetical protein